MILTSLTQLIALQFEQTTWLEWLGTLTGFVCVYLAARQKVWNWPVAIISSLAYAVLFFDYKLYGDAVLQVYFVGTSIYGWYYWLKRKEEHARPIVSLNGNEFLKVTGGVVLLSVLMGLFLDNYTDTNVPYADGFCTAISFVAQFLMARKILQNWILWIVADVCYIPLYIYKNLALTTVLYMLFLVLAVMGYLDWKKTWKTAVK